MKLKTIAGVVIRIPLKESTESVGIKAKRKKALEDWDRRRDTLWDIALGPVDGRNISHSRLYLNIS